MSVCSMASARGCPLGKRPSVSNSYLRTFNRENVALISDHIERITPKGIRFGLGAVKNVGEGAVEGIIEARSSGGRVGFIQGCFC